MTTSSGGPRTGRPSGFLTGFRFQCTALAGQADTYFALVASPFLTLVFMSVMHFSGRGELNASAVIAPVLMTLWTAALMFSGEMISEDRENGRFESLVATPTPFSRFLFGRLCACMLLALPSFAMSLLVAGLTFGYWLSLHHPLVFAIGLLATCLATAATATALSAVFVAAPGARIVQNTLSFPVFLLGGTLTPVSVFPDWLEAISRLLYLSWAADLLRAAAAPQPLEHAALQLGAVAVLGLVAFAAGTTFISRFLLRARNSGTLSRD